MNTSNIMTRMELRRMRQKRFRRIIFFYGMVAAAALALGLLILQYSSLFYSPEKTVSNFALKMKAGDYSSAYQLLECSGPLLTEKAFITAQKNLKVIKEISFKPLDNNKFQIREVRDSKMKEYVITTVNKGSNIFPQWCINASPFTEKISILTSTKDARLIIDKKELGKSTGQTPITYHVFNGYNHIASLHLEGAQTQMFKMPANRSAKVGYMVAEDDLKNSLSTFIYQYENSLSQSYLDWNTEPLKQYLKVGSQGEKWAINTIANLKNSWTKKNKWLINFKTGNAYLIDPSHAVIEIEGTWSDLYKPVKLNYLLEKNKNEWKIETTVAPN